MNTVLALAFAGHEIPITVAAMDGDPKGSWVLVALVGGSDTSLPADGWIEAQTETGRVIAWGTLTEDSSTAVSGHHRLRFVDAIAPPDAVPPTVALPPAIEQVAAVERPLS